MEVVGGCTGARWSMGTSRTTCTTTLLAPRWNVYYIYECTSVTVKVCVAEDGVETQETVSAVSTLLLFFSRETNVTLSSSNFLDKRRLGERYVGVMENGGDGRGRDAAEKVEGGGAGGNYLPPPKKKPPPTYTDTSLYHYQFHSDRPHTQTNNNTTNKEQHHDQRLKTRIRRCGKTARLCHSP